MRELRQRIGRELGERYPPRALAEDADALGVHISARGIRGAERGDYRSARAEHVARLVLMFVREHGRRPSAPLELEPPPMPQPRRIGTGYRTEPR